MKAMRYFIMGIGMMISVAATAQDIVKYVKLTVEPKDWSGTYLIAYEDDDNNQALIFNGALLELDSKNNYIIAPNDYQDIDGNSIRTIDPTDDVDAAVFTVTPSETEGAYCIRSASGFNIGYNKTEETDEVTGTTTFASDGTLEANLKSDPDKVYDNTFAMEEGKTNVIITASNGYQLRWNKDATSMRFRYYFAGKKKAIKLYKRTEISTGISTANVSRETKSVKIVRNGKLIISTPHGDYTITGMKL